MMEEQLSQSSITNSELEKSLREREEQVEGLVAHVTDLRSEISLLRDHVTSHHTHNNNILVKDLERLCLRNAELSDALAATRHSRTLLEREMVSLKRSLLEARSHQSQLEGSLREVEREREDLAERVASSEGEGRRRLREMQRQLDSVLADSGRLEGTLSSLGSEKELLATSLRQEANYNKQLEEEKEALEAHLHETSQRLELSQVELQRLQDSQVSEINAKCREIDRMKLQLQQDLGGLVGEKDALARELQETKEHLGRVVGEKDGLAQELQETREQLGRLVGEKDALTSELRETREELGRVAGEKDGLARELRETREQLGRTRAENERLLSECGSLHESLASVEGRRGELEVETGRLKREVEEERRRCERVEREGRDAAETANERAKQQVNQLSSRVKFSAQQLQQVVEENRTLQERLARVEGQLSQERSEYCAATDRLQGSLERVMSELDSTLTDLESTRTNNMLLKQQVSDLESQVSGLRGQLDGRGELLQEMKALLEQRASRIRQLERERRDSGDVLNLSHNTQDSSFVDTASLPSLDRPSPSPSLLTPPYHSASKLTASPVRFSSPTAESFHLKQRLADSRHTCVQLEVQQASLKTEVAKLQGSLQALTTIREHLTEENNALREANKGLEERCVVCVREKEEAERELAAATEALESLGVEMDELRQEVDELGQEKEEQQEEMQAAVDELEELCNEKDKELSELQLASQVMREEEGVVQRELVHLRREVEEWRKKAMKLEQTVDSEASRLQEETARCNHAVSTLRAEAIEVRESNRITEAVNVTQSGQIQEREARVSSLLGEVEVLRARKAVVLRFLGEREGGEREVWRRERERMEVEIRKLQGEVRQLTRELQQCREEGGGGGGCEGEGGGGGGCEGEVQAALEEALREKDLLKQQLARYETTPPYSELPPARPMRMETVMVERLRRKLKTQVHQTNYLRMRLGYTLSELRLYKQAKQELDAQLGELQRGLRSSQQQYSQCLLQLQQAERLGFAGH